MKKSFIIFIVLISILCVGLFSGCNKPSIEDSDIQNISYYQTTFYRGLTNNFEVKICAGNSEVLFVADGKTNECKDFCTITVIPLSVDLFNYDYKFKIEGENGTIEGDLTKDAFGAYFSSDIEIDSLGQILKTTLLFAKDNSVNIDMQNLLSDCIDGKKAIDIAKDSLKDKLDSDNKDREIYVRLINNSNKPESEFYWYVAFIANPTDYYSCLISPKDGSIISVTE